MPTLLTKRDTSISYSCLNIIEKKSYFWHSAKSATINFVWIYKSSCRSFIFFKAAYIFPRFLAIMQMLNPKAANYSQKPSPIPSLPPVTTAHEGCPYLSLKFLLGKMALIKLHSILEIQTIKKIPPIIAKK